MTDTLNTIVDSATAPLSDSIFLKYIGYGAAGAYAEDFLMNWWQGSGMPELAGREAVESAVAGGISNYLVLAVYGNVDVITTWKAVATGAAANYLWWNFIRAYAVNWGLIA